MKRIVVTGATGFIGRMIIKQALAQGCEVVCLVHASSSRLDLLPQCAGVRVVSCSMEDYAGMVWDGEDCDVFFHLAWEATSGANRDNAEVQIANIQYTVDALRLARRMGCRVFVGAGSQAEYGVVSSGEVLRSTTGCFPVSGYGIAKLAAGHMGYMVAQQLGVRFNWIRILSVYGVGDSQNSLISYVIRELQANHKPVLSACEQIWDYLNVEDAARAFLSVADCGRDGFVYPLGSGVGRPLREYIEDIYAMLDADCGLGFGERSYYPHQPMYLVADVEPLCVDTGWRPQVSFREGIGQLLKV